MALTVGSGTINVNQFLTPQKNVGTEKNLSTNGNNVAENNQPADDESPVALLQRFSDSTDEMSAALAQFRSRRDLEKKAGASADGSFDRVLDDDVHDKVDQILRVFKVNIDVSANELLRFVKSMFPDDSDLILVLREMLRRRDLNKVVRERLERLLEHAEQQADPKRLKAGINVALKARLFGKTLDMSPGLMRESYRNFIESDLHEILLYQEWIVSYGAEHRTIVVDFMESALMADIDALDPSCSNIEFGNLLGRIGQIKLLRSSDISFVKSLATEPVVKNLQTTEREWVFFMLGILQHAGSFVDYFTDIIRNHAQITQTTQSELLQLIFRACKKIPPQLFFVSTDKEELEQDMKQLAQELWLQETAELRNAVEQKNK